MAEFIELTYYDPSDISQKLISKLFKISLITEPGGDESGNIWFDYEGKEVCAKGDVDKFMKALTGGTD